MFNLEKCHPVDPIRRRLFLHENGAQFTVMLHHGADDCVSCDFQKIIQWFTEFFEVACFLLFMFLMVESARNLFMPVSA